MWQLYPLPGSRRVSTQLSRSQRIINKSYLKVYTFHGLLHELQPRLPEHELHKEGVAPVSIVTTQAPLLHEAGALIHPPRSNAARVDVQHDRGRRGASEGPPKLRNSTAKQRSAYAPSSEGLLAQKELWCGAAACQP